MSGEAVEVFFSYSHKDEALRDQLATHLKLLERQGMIAAWHDRKIVPGSEWAVGTPKIWPVLWPQVFAAGLHQ